MKKIKVIIFNNSKYDTIVDCLQPCLGNRKLEECDYACINGRHCTRCGFRRLWSGGLQKTVCTQINDAVDAEINAAVSEMNDSTCDVVDVSTFDDELASCMIDGVHLTCREWNKKSID